MKLFAPDGKRRLTDVTMCRGIRGFFVDLAHRLIGTSSHRHIVINGLHTREDLETLATLVRRFTNRT